MYSSGATLLLSSALPHKASDALARASFFYYLTAMEILPRYGLLSEDKKQTRL
jgi:hypothetical protein